MMNIAQRGFTLLERLTVLSLSRLGRWVRSVGIGISGRRVDDANSERRLVTRVAVRNDRLIRTP